MLDLPIPEDLTREILLRIPFESILACKLVSKRWNNVINDPWFYSRYRNTSVGFYLGEKGVYCLLTRYGMKLRNDGFPSYTVHRIPIKMGLKLNEEITEFDILGFDLLPGLSNGIACLTKYKAYSPFQLFNLFTGASYTVEISPLMMQQRRVKCSQWGFGYDACALDYKIFRRYHYSDKSLITFKWSVNDADGYDDIDDSDEFWIYSFKDESWKQVNGFPEYYWPNCACQACSFNGALHWVAVSRHTEKRVVVTYDLHSGKFGQVLLPKEGCNLGGDTYTTGKLSELNGQLCYVYQTGAHDDFSFCVWVMKESWTKLLALDHLTLEFSHWRMINHATPILLHERGDGRKVMLLSRRISPRLFWYDLHDGATQEVDTNSDFPTLATGLAIRGN